MGDVSANLSVQLDMYLKLEKKLKQDQVRVANSKMSTSCWMFEMNYTSFTNTCIRYKHTYMYIQDILFQVYDQPLRGLLTLG